MLTFAKIGLVGLVLLSSKMANAEASESCLAGNFFDEKTKVCRPCRPGEYQPKKGMKTCHKCPDNKFTHIAEGAKSVEDCIDEESFRCGPDFINALEQELKCNAKNPKGYCCNYWGWCGEGKENCECKNCTNYRKLPTTNYNNDSDQDETDSDDDKTSATSTTSDCQSKICIDYTTGLRNNPAHLAMTEIYRYDTTFVKEEDKNGRYLYKSIAKDDKKKKPKYAIWWDKGIWMVGEYDKRYTLTAFAVARSDEKCPEKINYIWRYYQSYDKTFRDAGEGMSVYDVNC